MKYILFVLLLLGIFSLDSCKNSDEPNMDDNSGTVVFNFEHFADGAPLSFDEMKYINAAGNPYEVKEIQWFASDITLIREDDTEVVIDEEKFAHYIDTNRPATSSWAVDQKIPPGSFKAIKLTFGIKGEKNTPFMFTDPPESDMLWPINLGGEQGGYHYMKLNGFWMNEDDQREPFNFHLGVGQERDVDNNVTGFVQNWFQTELPASFELLEGESKDISIRMNVEKWWEQPNIYDHNVHGGKIMQNQQAMRMGVENGMNAFSVGGFDSSIE